MTNPPPPTPPQGEGEKTEMHKILVIQTASIGDVILATPVIEKLHRFYPEARIDFLLKKGCEGLFKGHPFLNEVIAWDKKKKFSSFLPLLSEIRKKKYDVVVDIQRFALTGLLTAFSGSKSTIGFDKNPLSRFFSKKIGHEIREGIHEVNRNLSLIRDLTDDSFEKPQIYPTSGDVQKISMYKSGVYCTIAPASLWFTKQYPLDKWIEFIKHIPPETIIYFLGSDTDADLCEEILRSSGHSKSVNLAGKLTFLESAALMKDAGMNFTNDSAPMHLASAVNAPVTVIYCSTVPGFGFGPLSDSSYIVEVREFLYCRPCGLHGFKQCPEKHFRCATTISVEQLIEKLP